MNFDSLLLVKEISNQLKYQFAWYQLIAQDHIPTSHSKSQSDRQFLKMLAAFSERM